MIVLAIIAWAVINPRIEERQRVKIEKYYEEHGWGKPQQIEIPAMTPEERGCAVIYLTTYDKKLGDLTSRDIDSIRYCQAKGLYH